MPPLPLPKHLAIDPTLCRVCGRCIAAQSCRGMAFVRLDHEDPPVIDMARCRHCLACLEKCPFNAIVWE